MKTTFETASFKKALATVAPAVARSSTLNILTHVRVRMANIDGSDLQIQITAPVHSKGDPINVCIPADRLKAAVAVAGESMVFETGKGACIIKSGQHRFKVPTLPGDEFPIIDETEAETSFEATEGMHSAMANISFAAAVNDVRDYLNGIQLECRNGMIEATATNGGFAATTKVGECHKDFVTLIRKQAFEVLTKSAPGVWHVSRSMVVLESDEARIVVKAMEGKYPDWRRIMRGGDHSITLSRAELIEAVSLSKLMRDVKKLRPMRIVVDGEVLKITTSMNSETIETELPIVDVTGPGIDMGLNGDLLEPILRAHGDESITFTYGDAPIASIMTENGDFRAVLSPLRI